MSYLKKTKRLAMLNGAIPTLFRNKLEHSNRNHSNPSQLHRDLKLEPIIFIKCCRLNKSIKAVQALTITDETELESISK